MTRTRGFTLVELLVAVSLLSVLLVLLFSAMRTGIRSWQVSEDRISAMENVVQTERFLARLISQAHDPGGRDSGTAAVAHGEREGGASFAGTADRIVLVAPGVSALPRAGLYRYEVFREPRNDSSGLADLWVHIDPYRPDDEETIGKPRLLLEGVSEFAIRYFGATEPDGAPQWTDEWPLELGVLPLLVQIHLQPDGAPARPVIIAAPALALAEGT